MTKKEIISAKTKSEILNNCYNCINCDNCISCYNCYNCIICYNCYNCYNCEHQTGKQFMVRNVQLSKEQFENWRDLPLK